jgi:hypothetical protein
MLPLCDSCRRCATMIYLHQGSGMDHLIRVWKSALITFFFVYCDFATFLLVLHDIDQRFNQTCDQKPRALVCHLGSGYVVQLVE